MASLDGIKEMDVFLGEFNSRPSVELLPVNQEDITISHSPNQQQQQFADDFFQQSKCASASDFCGLFSVTDGINEEGFTEDSFDNFTSFLADMEESSSASSTEFRKTQLGFYNELKTVQRDNNGVVVGNDINNSKARNSAKVNSKKMGDLPDTTFDKPSTSGLQSLSSSRTDLMSSSCRRRKSAPVDKKASFSKKRTRYTFSPAHIKIFESLFNTDQYPKRHHLEELEQRFNIPEDKLRTWFQNRRAKNKRAKNFTASKETKTPVVTIEQKMTAGKPVQYVSPHSVKPPNSNLGGRVYGGPGLTSIGNTSQCPSVEERSYSGLLPLSPPATPTTPTRWRYISPALSSVRDAVVRTPEVPPRDMLTSETLPRSTVFSSLARHGTGESSNYNPLPPVSNVSTKLCYPQLSYGQFPVSSWSRNPTLNSSTTLPRSYWQAAGGYQYAGLHPFPPSPMTDEAGKTDHSSLITLTRGYPYQTAQRPDVYGGVPQLGQTHESMNTRGIFSYTYKPPGGSSVKFVPALYSWPSYYPEVTRSSYSSGLVSGVRGAIHLDNGEVTPDDQSITTESSGSQG